MKFESSLIGLIQHDTWSVWVYPCCQKTASRFLHAVHTLTFLCSQKITWFSTTWSVELRAVWAGNNPPAFEMNPPELTWKTLCWSIPQQPGSDPGSSNTDPSAGGSNSGHPPNTRFLRTEGADTITSTADIQMCHVITFLTVYSCILGEKGLIWHISG